MRLRAIASTLVCQLCLAIVCQAGSALADKVEKAQKDYDTAKESAAIAYRKAFSEALDGAKKVEIYLLTSAGEPQATISDEDPFSEHLPNDLFPILPYKSAAKIIQRSTA